MRTREVPDQPSISRPIDRFEAWVTPQWWLVRIWDLDRGSMLRGVVEACASEGWVVQVVFDERGQRRRDAQGVAITERRERRVLILTRTRAQRFDRRRRR